ncbi:MAG: MoaD/ThiS family protein [Gemmataceae bacterium]
MSEVVVELFGLARARAGTASVLVKADTVRELLVGLASSYPRLGELIHGERMSPHYLLSLDGVRFVTGLDEPLTGQRLLLLAADAGG